MQDKKFIRNKLLDKSYVYKLDDQKIIVNAYQVRVEGVIIENPDQLQHFASVLSSAYLDHQNLARGEKPKEKKEFKQDDKLGKKIRLVGPN